MCSTEQSRQAGTTNRELSQLIGNMGMYKTQPLTEMGLTSALNKYYGSALQNLMGAQTRSLGTAAGSAGGYAASKGLNPYALTQHAQAGVYDRFTDQFGNLSTAHLGALSQVPGQVFQSGLASNQAMIDMLMSIYGLKQGAMQGLNKQSFMDYFAPFLEAGGKVAGAALMPTPTTIYQS